MPSRRLSRIRDTKRVMVHEDNPCVFVVDDDQLTRESLPQSAPLHGAHRPDICISLRIFDQPAARGPQLPGARCPAPGAERARAAAGTGQRPCAAAHHFYHRRRRHPDDSARHESRNQRLPDETIRDEAFSPPSRRHRALLTKLLYECFPQGRWCDTDGVSGKPHRA